MTSQEERLSNKMNDIHKTVKEQNTRIRKNEIAIVKIAGSCNKREETCAKTLKELQPSIRTTRALNLMGKRPKLTAFIGIVLLLGLQAIVMAAFQNNWISELIKFVKP